MGFKEAELLTNIREVGEAKHKKIYEEIEREVYVYVRLFMIEKRRKEEATPMDTDQVDNSGKESTQGGGQEQAGSHNWDHQGGWDTRWGTSEWNQEGWGQLQPVVALSKGKAAAKGKGKNGDGKGGKGGGKGKGTPLA